MIVVKWLSCGWFFVTPWTAAHQASLSFPISWSLLTLVSTESMMPSKHPILCCPFFLLPLIFSTIRVFSNELAYHIRWPKYWSFSFSTSPSNEYAGLISFRIDSFDLLAIQGTLKSLLQHDSSKASILQCSVKMSSLGYYHKIQQKNVLQKGENGPNLTDANKHQERGIR